VADLRPLAPTVSFAVFTADLQSGELHKNGVKVRLERQPFQVLSMLLEHPHELVSREQLRNRVWPQDTFVDFDHALNTAITKIRMALGDDADNPRFVETVPRRGYRLIVPINGTAGRVLAVTDATPSTKSASSIPKPLVLAVIGIVLVVLGGLSAFWLRSPVPPPKVLRYTQLTSDGQYKDDLYTDGNRLYFSVARSDGSGGLSLAQISAAGGQVSRVSVPFERVGLSDVSPDGSSLLVHPYSFDPDDSKATYVVPLPDGTPRRLGGGTFGEAAWSPDGRWIAYNEGTDLYVARSDGSAPRKLSKLQGPPLRPRWSSDGKLLRFFVWNEIGGHSLWEIQSDGKHLRQLFPGWNNPAGECCGRWTPDGRYFIFQSSRGNARSDMASTNLWAVREKDEYFRKVNHNPVPLTLTSTGTTQIISAAPSRDGKRLFVISGNERYELVRYDKGSKNFLPYLSGVNGTKYRFSRDGLWMVYVSIADNTLWRSRIDGSERLQLTFPPMNANFVPAWSPDGSQIAFAGSISGGLLRIFRISRDGGNPEQLTEGKHGGGDVRPSWSPDGKTLVFGEYSSSGVPVGNPMYVWLLDLETRKLTTLPGSADLGAPSWSPDGRYICALSLEGRLLLFDFAGQKWTEIAKPPIEWHAWSRDGRYIQFGSIVKGETVLKRVRVSDRKVETVTSLKNLAQVGFNSYNTWLGVAPDDSPLAIRDASSYDIYALDWELP